MTKLEHRLSLIKSKEPVCASVWIIAIILVWTPALSFSDSAPSASAPIDPMLQCLQDLAQQPQFSEIATKLPLTDMRRISFLMLADESFPTPQQHAAIATWFDGYEKCYQATAPIHQAQWPPEVFQLSKEGKDGVEEIGVDLYNGKISFGEANKRLQQLGNELTAKLIPIIKQFRAEIAANNAAQEQRAAAAQAAADVEQEQEQQRRQQRAALILNYMRSIQPRVVLPPPPVTTQCTTIGNFTNCTSRQ